MQWFNNLSRAGKILTLLGSLIAVYLCFFSAVFVIGRQAKPSPTVVAVSMPTATAVPPTTTSMPPTHTPLPPTSTPVPPTSTPVPPTATLATPTDTPLPSTPTPQPTATWTPIPPTPAPTQTATSTPTSMPTTQVSLPPIPPVYNTVERKGTISKNETWTFGNIYVVKGDLIVKEGVTLTMEPGVIVKFSGGEQGDLHVEGTLRVEGTAERKIVFTSLFDDTVGGDTNSDGGANAPLPGDWDAIIFENSSDDANCVIRYAELKYGSGDGENAAIHLSNASPVLENITMVDNHINGFSVSKGTWRTNQWLNLGWAYVISRGEITIDERSTLTVGPGVVVKIRGGEDGDFHVEGTLRVEGLPEAPVIFTSFHDDSVGGDTDNDAGANAPLPGDWDAVISEDVSSDAQSIITYTEMRYGGGDGKNGPIVVNNSSPSLSNTAMENNRINGISVSGGEWKTNQWLATGIAYVVLNDITVDVRSTLTIGPGVVVKLRGGKDREIFVEGILHAEGTPENRIIFTSINDDSVGGDTNNDTRKTAPLGDDWDAIIFKGEVSSQSVLNFVDIRYGSDSPVRTDNASPSILDVNIVR